MPPTPRPPAPRHLSRWVLWLPVVILFVGIFICLQEISFFVRNVPDDGFYYLVISRQLAEGNGPTFDGITKTNGFHPLFAFVLAGLFQWIPATALGDIRITMAFGLLCHMVTGWLLFLALRRAGREEWAGWAAVFYWLNPYAFLRSFGAMEPPLYALCLTLLLYLLMRFRTDRNGPSGAILWPALLGLVAGLTLLARTDAIFLVPLVTLTVLIARARPVRITWQPVAWFAIAGTLVVLPWILYSWKHFGTVWQYSGLVKNHYRWQELGQIGGVGVIQEIAANYGVWIRKSIVTVPLTKYVLIAAGLAGFRWRGAIRWAQSLPPAIWIYLVFVVLVGGYYAVNYTQVRGWYLVPASVLMSWLSIHALRHLPGEGRTGRWEVARRILIGLLLAESLLYPALKLGRGINREQVDTFAMVQWAGRHLPPEARIGSFNAGIPAFFLSNPVANLDGLVNNEILEVIRRRNLAAYLDDRQIRLVLDQGRTGGTLRWLGGEEWFADRVRVRHRLRGPEKGIEMILWEILPAGDGGGEP